MMRLLRLAAFCLVAAAAAGRSGEAPPPETAAAFPAIRGARLPEAGEWLEYVVAFPADPLEKSIRDHLTPDPLPVESDPRAGMEAENIPLPELYVVDRVPAFEPAGEWIAMRLRLEITGVDGKGCRALMRYENRREEVTIPLAAGMDAGPAEETREEVSGDQPVDPAQLSRLFPDAVREGIAAPAPVREFSSHWLGDRSITVETERMPGPETGFVRMSSREVPFGLVRFASADLDFVLVGHGAGAAPEFPLPEARVEPGIGKLR